MQRSNTETNDYTNNYYDNINSVYNPPSLLPSYPSLVFPPLTIQNVNQISQTHLFQGMNNSLSTDPTLSNFQLVNPQARKRKRNQENSDLTPPFFSNTFSGSNQASNSNIAYTSTFHNQITFPTIEPFIPVAPFQALPWSGSITYQASSNTTSAPPNSNSNTTSAPPNSNRPSSSNSNRTRSNNGQHLSKKRGFQPQDKSNYFCLFDGEIDTQIWRGGIERGTLCNACGIRYNKMVKKVEKEFPSNYKKEWSKSEIYKKTIIASYTQDFYKNSKFRKVFYYREIHFERKGDDIINIYTGQKKASFDNNINMFVKNPNYQVFEELINPILTKKSLTDIKTIQQKHNLDIEIENKFFNEIINELNIDKIEEEENKPIDKGSLKFILN